MNDRRRYFRIMDQIILNITPVGADAATARIKQLREGGTIIGDDLQPWLALENELKSVLSELREQQPKIAKAIELLDLKFQYLMQHTDIPDTDRHQLESKQEPEQVNLSGCGIAFDTATEYKLRQRLFAELVLLPSYLSIKVVATVVKVKQSAASGSRQYNVCADFDYIRGEDQEQLIRHILRKQAESLQAQRASDE